MKIKQVFIVFFTAIAVFSAHAQTKAKAKAKVKTPVKATAFKCEPAFKTLEEQVKAKNYTNAVTQLPSLVKNCPKYDVKLYTYGETALKDKEVRSRDAAEKKAFLQELTALYDSQEKNYPGTGGAIKKALLLSDKKLAKDDEVYKLLNDAFAVAPQSFTDYNAIQLYFNLYLKEFEAGRGITQDQFIQKFGDVASQIAFAKNELNTKRAALHKKREEALKLDADEVQYLSDTRTLDKTFDAVAANMTKAAAKYLNCEKLEAYYTADFNKNKDNYAWLSSVVNVLSNSKCYRSDVLYNAALAVNKLNPDYNTAFQAGYISQKKGNNTDAIAYYEQAAEFLNDSPVQKADLYNDIAALYRITDKAKAKEYALKSAAANPKSGKPYLFIAGLYASPPRDCGLSDFDVKALNFLAIENLKKAEAAEPKYQPTVAALTKEYTENLPTKKDGKAFKKRKGDVIAYSCWINETVTLPKLK